MPYNTPEKERAWRQRPEIKARYSAYQRRWRNRPEVKARRKEQARAYYDANKEKLRERSWRRYHGTEEIKIIYRQNYQRRMVRLAGRARPDICDACGKSARTIAFDHCHKKGILEDGYAKVAIVF